MIDNTNKTLKNKQNKTTQHKNIAKEKNLNKGNKITRKIDKFQLMLQVSLDEL